jgi:hypothetical protein
LLVDERNGVVTVMALALAQGTTKYIVHRHGIGEVELWVIVVPAVPATAATRIRRGGGVAGLLQGFGDR